ncbi:MAG: acetate uptake transporter [Clostridiales bacterium]|nr:acetate uptake transporter [Clostridiales bacterium]
MTEKTNVDPSALGLFGLAMVTLVASSQKLGLTEGYAYVLPWAIFLGALAQLTAGILDYKKGNVFGATAFCAYGFFWLGMAAVWLTGLGAFGTALQGNADMRQLGVAFIGYLILTVFLTIGATRTNKVLFFIFVFIDLLFVGLSVSTFVSEGPVHNFFHYLAAVSELLIALLSFYGSGANVLNNHFGRTFLPIGKPYEIFAAAEK